MRRLGGKVAKVKAATKVAAPKQPMVKCPDCGVEYVAGAAHEMFCEAKTCVRCGATYRDLSDLHTMEDGKVCDDCLEPDEKEDVDFEE